MTRWRWHLLFAALVGISLRLVFVLHFSTDSGDTPVYEDLATSWLKLGTYAIHANGHLVPADIRVPGYPAFLAAIYALTGRAGPAARLWVMVAQAVIDLATCFLTAAFAAVLASLVRGPSTPRRVFVAALWLAATCPFIANYSAVPLTEVLAVFFTTAALIPFAMVIGSALGKKSPVVLTAWAKVNNDSLLCAIGGFLVGLGTLVRPETPLLLLSVCVVLGAIFLRQRALGKCVRLILLMLATFLTPLLPWAARNAVTLHKVQFLAPRYAELPGEVVPRGFMAWEKTWLFRFQDVYLISWKLEQEPIPLEDVPARAFDSTQERERVLALLAQHNESLALTAEMDAAFGQLARERTARHPLRTYVWVPIARMITLWFTPRTELLEISGHIWPLAKSWDIDPKDFSISFGFFLLNFVYAGLAAIGAVCFYRAAPAGSAGAMAGLALIALFVLVRTVFLTTIETPEPRYVLECVPAILALAAQTWNPQRSSTGSG